MIEKFSFRKEYRARTIFHIFNYLFMFFLLLLMLVPLLKVLSDSMDRSTQYGLNLIPKQFSLQAYIAIFTKQTHLRPFIISFITTISGTLLGLAMATLGAYVLSRKDLVGRNFLSMFVFITMIFNGGLIPTFLVVRGLGLVNKLWAVLLPSAVNVFFMILMRNFFDQIPDSLFESAEMDGASPIRVFIKIVLPLSKAALAAIGLFYAVQYWNAFFDYIMYISDQNWYNFQMKVREMILLDQGLMDPGVLGYGSMVKNAAVIVVMLPFIFVYPFAQRHFITGVTLGAIKE